MTNIIKLIDNKPLLELEAKLKDEELKQDEFFVKDKNAKREIIEATVEHSSADKSKKAELADNLKKVKANAKLIENQYRSQQDIVEQMRLDVAKLKSALNKEFVGKSNSTNSQKVFSDLNVHYVIMEQQWYSLDVAGDRTDMKINQSDSQVIRDLIFNDSGWEITQEQELKRLAKDMGRIYKHVVRDFSTAKRDGVYNQMNDIRKNWIKPIPDKTPHEAFRLLCLSVAGGSEEYADQLERYIAYRYCHPDDVMIPNLDSCAVGGTGRETYYNLFKMIFTDICCTSAAKETFCGTHNGELFGKMVIKVDEKNSSSVPIDVVKEITGGLKYRHRPMNKDARDVIRLFTFIFFRNGYTTTVKLAGSGSSGEDRRWEPIIARLNLSRHVAKYYGIIDDINTIPDKEEEKAAMMLIKDWQKDFYKNDERVAEWLGYIIKKYDAENMKELMPIHGIYYEEMVMRQQKGMDGFMPKFMNCMKDSNVISIKDAHKLFEVAENRKCTKEWFKNELMYWLNTKLGWDAEEATVDIYTWSGCVVTERRRKLIVQDKLNRPAKLLFDLNEFIDTEALNDKGSTVGEKINEFSIREELR